MRVWLAGIGCCCLVLFAMPACMVSAGDFDVREWLIRLAGVVSVACVVVWLGRWAYLAE